ncbi:MAG TPA: hypothetical protein VNJ04_16205 [Gemmatimonadaceae bacterium]|nr:hypothetical protein [Gemmatimonadaceae bacterium]
MTERSRPWQMAAAVFVFINVASIGWAIANREAAHAATHVGALIAGFFAWHLVPWGRIRELQRTQPSDERVEYLQQSVDAMALEVERIGEAQRYSDKLRAARIETHDGGR